MEQKFLTPQELEAILAGSMYPEGTQANNIELEISNRLRGEAPQMRSAGRVSVASNPLENLAYMANTMRANRMDRDTLKNQRALIEALRKARMTYGGRYGGTPPIAPPQASNASDVPSDVRTYGVPPY